MRRLSAYPYFLFLEGALSLAPFLVVALYFVKTVGLDPLQLVLVGTVMETAVLVSEVPTGVVADTFGRRRSMLISWTIQGAAIVLVGAVPQYWAALAGWALWGFGYTFMSGAYEAWITDEVGADKVGPVFARGVRVSYASALVGMPLFIGIATATSLQVAVIVNGALTIAVAVVSLALMPETGFRPAPREDGVKHRRAMLTTAAAGARLVRARPVLLLLLCTALFAGAHTEGFDRLKEAYFVRVIGLPAFGGLSELWWFSILGSGGLVLGLVASGLLAKRLTAVSQTGMTRALFAISALQIVTLIAFGLATGFAVAVAAYWAAGLARSLVYPVYMTWLNQSIDDSSVRATVISITGQADALGQVAGGPGVGAIGSSFGLRAALVASGLVLTPTLALYGRAMRNGGKEPELIDLPQLAEA